ncbi:MAG: alpha/beta hydrolase, partial [Chloroflexota bacterium]
MNVMYIILILLLVGIVYQLTASRRDLEKFPAPYILIMTSLGETHLKCQGEGPVSVVLVTELADSLLEWEDVQSAMAEFTRVCAYDRPGIGWSSPAAKPLTAQQIADHLHETLEGGEVPKPYILAAHSIGGVYARAFAQQYPEDLAGLVLIDSSHENQSARLPAAMNREFTMIKLLATVLGALTPFGIPRALKLADRMQGEYFSDAVRPAAMARMYQSHFFTTFYNEAVSAKTSTANSQPPADLGGKPLVVLSRGDVNPGISEELFEELKQGWAELQQELGGLSTNSKHIIAEESSHFIHRDQPK